MNLPNLLTSIRIFLIPIFIYYMLKESYPEAIALFALGSISDALDGYFARKLNQVTSLGKILDPVADKLFLLSSFTVSYLINIIPFWLMAIVILKEVVLLSGFMVLYATIKKVEIKPIFIGKAATAAQMVTILLVLVSGVGIKSETLLTAAFIITSILMISSALGYVMIGIKTYREAL